MRALQQRYANIYVFAAAHGITLKRDQYWRLTDRLLGEITGVPNSRGILTATNGIDCYIEQERSGRIELFLGHMDWFVADSGRDVETIKARAGISAPAPTRATVLSERLALYD